MRFIESILILAGIAALHAALVLSGVVPAMKGGQINLLAYRVAR